MQRMKKPEENKIKTRQQIKKVKSKRCCRRQSTWLIIAPLSHRYHPAVAPLSLRCCSFVALMSHRYRSSVAPPPFLCRSAAVAPPLSLRCCAAVALLSHRYRSTVAPMLSLMLLLRSRTANATLLGHCRSAAVAPSVTTQLHRYCSVVAPLLNRCRSGPERI